jgi:type III secretory pathway component EscR
MAENWIASPLGFLAISFVVTLIPILFLLISPFLKLSIVFGALRVGFGTQGIPGTAAISALSLILSLHVLGPVILETVSEVEKVIEETGGKFRSKDFYEAIRSRGAKVMLPVEKFLSNHVGVKEKKYFSVSNDFPSLFNLIPAFVLSELRLGFEMALLLYIPFLVIDLVVTSLLTAMGMMMVNPVNLTFPIKLLLFINCDGWLGLSQSLVSSYR